MQFDSRYAACKMVEKLAQQAGLVPMLEQAEEAEESEDARQSEFSNRVHLGRQVTSQ